MNAYVYLLYFMDRSCNYNHMSHDNGTCAYKGKRRKACIIYMAECKICIKAYVGCTQDMFKARMTQHFSDVVRLTSTKKRKLAKNDKHRSDTLAKHSAANFPRDATAQ
eukprot:15365653-Ditylum_brightwellii.AAC.1